MAETDFANQADDEQASPDSAEIEQHDPESDEAKNDKAGVGAGTGIAETVALEGVLENMYHGSGDYDNQTVETLFRRLRGPLEALRFGDRNSLRDHLVLLHAPLVEHCARNFRGSNEPLDDLVQEGYVGLIKAVDRYDPEKGVRFSTYAYHLIVGEMRHYLRDLGRLIHEPGWHFELRQRITRETDKLTQRLGRPPKLEEIGEAVGVPAAQVGEVLRNQQTLTVEHLDGGGSEENDNGDRAERVSDDKYVPDLTEARVDNQLMLGTALPKLRDLEKRVVSLYFFEDCTKTEIARRLDISVNYAAYLIKRGLENLRQIIEASDSLTALPSQQQARAAYLLTQARDASLNGKSAKKKSSVAPAVSAASAPSKGERRHDEPVRLGPTVPPIPRSGIASFVEWSAWVDEEVQRSGRYKQQFALLWLQIGNWPEVAAKLDSDDVRRVSTAIRSLVRRCCRAMDRISVLSDTTLPGLHFLIMMPHTGERGQRVGERWQELCRPEELGLPASAGMDDLETRFATAVFPDDGKKTEDLFRVLGTQIEAGIRESSNK